MAVGLIRPGVEQFVWVRQLVAKEQRADSHSYTHTHTHTLRWGLGWAVRDKSTEKRTDRAREREREREEGATKQSFMRSALPPLAVILS